MAQVDDEGQLGARAATIGVVDVVLLAVLCTDATCGPSPIQVLSVPWDRQGQESTRTLAWYSGCSTPYATQPTTLNKPKPW